MALDVRHWGGTWGSEPVVVATTACNGIGFTPHQVWAWRRAEVNALAESPFLCSNGTRLLMAPIPTLPPNVTGAVRLQAILVPLIEPLLHRLEALAPPSQIAIVLCLGERFADDSPAELRAGRGAIQQAVAGLLRANGIAGTHLIIPRGHAGFAYAILEACAALAARKIDAAIVGGVDSYHDPDFIEALLRKQKLFDGENLDTFIPGEGGAFCLLTRGDVASRNRWPVLSYLQASATNEEPAHSGTDLPCLGLGLSRPMRAIADRLQAESRFIDLWLTDLTNENYRMNEWMLAFPRASAGVSKPGAQLQLLPTFMGDLGAATMPTGAVLAVEAFLRGDPQAQTCLLVGASPGVHRGAVLLASEAAAKTGR